MLKRLILLTVLLSTVAAGLWHQQALADWWFLRGYEPDSEIAALADNSYMSDYGRRLFYVSDPSISNRQEFNNNCPIIEESFVLGCYSDRRIHVLNVDRQELNGVMEVTAAHEMLHAAYDRLSHRDREEVVNLLEDFYSQVDDTQIRSLVRSYESSGGVSVRQNELHSILPTQLLELPDELEDYYSQYFTDRQSVARMYHQYESVFANLNDRIDKKRAELNELRSEIGALEDAIALERSRIERLNNRLEVLEDRGDTEAYNQLVPDQNAAVDRHNGLVDRQRAILNMHNTLVDEINQLVLLQNDLVNSLDSTFEPI